MKNMLLTVLTSFIALAMILSMSTPAAHAQGNSVRPIVFQAAGPTVESIQGTVNAFRAALGVTNNGNAPGPLDIDSGHREINWDGGGSDVTDDPVTPFNNFLNTRGAQFTTPGTGLSQAPTSGGPQGGLAVLFDNPTYSDIFTPFSPVRLFTPVGSRLTDGLFFVPGTNGATPATVTGFGVVFTDVDQPNGEKSGEHSTRIDYFDADGKRLFTGFVPSSPGDGSVSFFGIVFEDPRIASVRIKTGDSRPGPDDGKKDIVMMDDFIYGEPQPLP